MVLTPNLIRILALKLINKEQTLLVNIGNMIVSLDNRVRLMTRIIGYFLIGLQASFLNVFSYGVFLAIIYFRETAHCGYNCDRYFEKLPQNEPIEIDADRPTGHLVINGNDDARQVAIYIPSQSPKKII